MGTRIEWTQCTWNPVTGCTKLSAGCLNCYAERMATRLCAMGSPRYSNGFRVTPHPQLLTLPFSWRTPRRVFVNSMGDLFHEAVPVEFVRRVFDVMHRASHHLFQVLTKRAERLAELAPALTWPSNVWIGVTVEDGEYSWRVDRLREVPAAVRFLSLEPLLGPVPELRLEGIGWVIVGGESGPGARPMRPEWAQGVRDLCLASGVPFFFKQWGGVRRNEAGRHLDGRIWEEYPEVGMAAAASTQADLGL